MPMLHHISFAVADLQRAAGFYDPVLAALGHVRVFEDLRPGEDGQAIGYGPPGQGDGFCIKQAAASSASAGPGFHLAFAAADRAAVDEFHRLALLHGGTDNGAPGLRPHYGPDYYACFVIDPEGHRLEAVINQPPPAAERARSPQAAPNLAAADLKAFVPAADLARSIAFYSALGFEIPWSTPDLAHVRHGPTGFLLQALAPPGFAANFQMHLLVDNVDDWHAHVLSSEVASRFGVEVGTPLDQPWAMRDFTLFDPSGVLWRIAQPIARDR